MTIIDFHTHAFPDSLAERAISSLAESADWQPEGDGTVAGLLRLMEQAGVDQSVLASVATKPEQLQPIIKWSLKIRSERIEPFASIHPDSPDVGADVAAVVAAGLKGVKLHAMYQRFKVDEPRLFPLYEALDAAGLIVLFHAGRDVAFGDDDSADPARVVSVVDQFPNLIIVLAHMGGWRTYDSFIQHLLGRDVYIDTAFSADFCKGDSLKTLLAKHSADRILFATDSPWGSMQQHLDYVNSFPVSDAVREKIFHGNAERLLASRP
jgi:uncharacterized protein